MKEDMELGKDNPSRERVKYEIGQKIITMKTQTRKSSNVVTSIRLKL